MLEVLRTFHSLNVQWKRIGPFNMKCIWLSPACPYLGARLNGCVSGTQAGPNQICSSSTAAGISLRFRDTVKFEIQVNMFSPSGFCIESMLKWISIEIISDVSRYRMLASWQTVYCLNSFTELAGNCMYWIFNAWADLHSCSSRYVVHSLHSRRD